MRLLRASERLDVRALRAELADMRRRLDLLEISRAGCVGQEPAPSPEPSVSTVAGEDSGAAVEGPADARGPDNRIDAAPEPDIIWPEDIAALEREPEPIDYEAEAFAATAARVRDRRVERPIKPPPKTDWAKVAEAHRARPVGVPKAAPGRPLPIATDREGCVRCGIPGWRGCAHQRPYQG